MIATTQKKEQVTRPMLHLVEYPNVMLTTQAKTMEFTEENLDFCRTFLGYYDFIKTRIGPSVAGIAAPQVDKNLKVFIAYGELYINPEIIWLPSQGTETQKEGCLSLPLGQFWELTRPYSVRIRYQNIRGEWHEKKFNNINARVVLHEMDHLEGKLCCGEYYSKHTIETNE